MIKLMYNKVLKMWKKKENKKSNKMGNVNERNTIEDLIIHLVNEIYA